MSNRPNGETVATEVAVHVEITRIKAHVQTAGRRVPSGRPKVAGRASIEMSRAEPVATCRKEDFDLNFF